MARDPNGRLPAAEQRRATAEDFEWAVAQLRAGTIDHPFFESTEYDLVLPDGRRFPPKAVFGLALSHALGRRVGPEDFKDGRSSICHRRLTEAGFHIATKPGVWALVANPKFYRIEDAVQHISVDKWTTKGKPIRKGDLVVIWKAKGNEADRGVVALGFQMLQIYGKLIAIRKLN